MTSFINYLFYSKTYTLPEKKFHPPQKNGKVEFILRLKPEKSLIAHRHPELAKKYP